MKTNSNRRCQQCGGFDVVRGECQTCAEENRDNARMAMLQLALRINGLDHRFAYHAIYEYLLAGHDYIGTLDEVERERIIKALAPVVWESVKTDVL